MSIFSTICSTPRRDYLSLHCKNEYFLYHLFDTTPRLSIITLQKFGTFGSKYLFTLSTKYVYGTLPCLQLFGWCEGGLGQQRNDGGGCSSMRERSERVESPGA